MCVYNCMQADSMPVLSCTLNSFRQSLALLPSLARFCLESPCNSALQHEFLNKQV